MVEPTPQEVIASLQSVIRQLGTELEAAKAWQESVLTEVGPEPPIEYLVAHVGGEPVYGTNPQWIEWTKRRAEHLAAKLVEAQTNAERWQWINKNINWSFDSQDRTFYLRAKGRVELQEFVDAALAGQPAPIEVSREHRSAQQSATGEQT